MKRQKLLGIVSLLVVGYGVGAALPEKQPPALAHMVFFDLKDGSDAAKEKLVQGCKRYLSGHEGTVYFSAGTRATDLDREVNDRAFDVALHIVFRDQKAHDRYQTHARHLEFIAKHKDSWSRVRVFDSHVRPAAGTRR